MKPIEVRLALRFKIEGKVEGGHQSLLYRATHTQTNDKLILKGQEAKSSKNKKAGLGILQEGKIYQSMQGGIGIPYMHWCGQEEDYNFIVLDEMDTTISKLLTRCGGTFSLKTAMMLGMQLTEIMQYFHFKSYVYNNFNTKHIMLGSGQNYGKIYIIDMNKSSKFKDSVMHEHIPEPNDKAWEMRFGNMEFSSLNYQRGLPTTRRDDMESLLYLISYVLNGSLPWSQQIWNMKKTQFEKCRHVAQTKSDSGEQLFKGYPQLESLYNYTLNLKFDEKPQYAFYISTFTKMLQKNDQIDDKMYDWFFLEDEGPLELNHKFQLFEGEEELIQKISNQLSENKNENIPVRPNSKIPSKKVIPKGKGDKECMIY